LTIPQALSEAARKFAGRPALIGPGVALTHAQLDGCVARAAAALEKQGVKPNDVVGVSMETSPLHLVTLLALGRTGACSVHVWSEHPRPVKETLVAQFGVAHLIGGPGRSTSLRADPAWVEPGVAPAHEDRAIPASPWRIALSSGTTGLQKAVRFTHLQILDYLELHDRAVPMNPDERYLCHRGLDSNLALNTAICHLRAGGAVVFPASRSLAHAIEAIDRHAVTQLALPPNFLRDLLDLAPEGGVRFPGLRLIRVAGSTVSPALEKACKARLSPNLASVYGMVEIGFATVGGRVVPGIQVEVVDGQDAPLPAGTTGILRLRRTGMPQEYFRNPVASEKAYRNGWFYPGDTGRIDADGLVHIEGRVDDKLNLDGLKVEPGPVERALQEHPSVVDAIVFAAAPDGGPSALFAAATLRAPVEEKALIAHCRSRVGRMFTPVRIFFVKDFPRNDAGKVLRTELARRVARPKP